MDSGASRCADARDAPRRRARRARGFGTGFTLVEVLVALTIVSVAMLAALRSVGSLANNSAELRARTLAQWSAENRLAQMRIQSEWPATGRNRYDCGQGSIRLVCQEDVFPTPNPSFRRIELKVLEPDTDRQLARLVGFATNLP